MLFQVKPFADERAKHVRQQLSNIMVRRAFKIMIIAKCLVKVSIVFKENVLCEERFI